MEPKIIKISAFMLFILLLFLSCSDDSLMNIYNKYTEDLRSTPDDLKVLSSFSNLPLGGTNVVLTKPAGDTLASVTNSEGFALFMMPSIPRGTYSVKAVLYLGGSEYSRRSTYYLNEKNNSTLIIYINETLLYK
jgi:hypothetical protein